MRKERYEKNMNNIKIWTLSYLQNHMYFFQLHIKLKVFSTPRD